MKHFWRPRERSYRSTSQLTNKDTRGKNEMLEEQLLITSLKKRRLRADRKRHGHRLTDLMLPRKE